mgnify:CR=1 FL=1
MTFLLNVLQLILQKNIDQLLIADSYNKEEFVLKDCVFSDVRRGDFTFRGKYTAENVLYMKCRMTNMKMLIDGIYSTYEKLLDTAIAKYHRSGKEKGILEVSAMAKGSPSFEEDFEVLAAIRRAFLCSRREDEALAEGKG